MTNDQWIISADALIEKTERIDFDAWLNDVRRAIAAHVVSGKNAKVIAEGGRSSIVFAIPYSELWEKYRDALGVVGKELKDYGYDIRTYVDQNRQNVTVGIAAIKALESRAHFVKL